jgi:hypothetical protein
LRAYRDKSPKVPVGGDDLAHNVLDARSENLRVEGEITPHLGGLTKITKSARKTLPG